MDESDQISAGKQRFSILEYSLKAAEHRRTPKHLVQNADRSRDVIQAIRGLGFRSQKVNRLVRHSPFELRHPDNP